MTPKTVRLPDDLWNLLQAWAHDEHRSLNGLVWTVLERAATSAYKSAGDHAEAGEAGRGSPQGERAEKQARQALTTATRHAGAALVDDDGNLSLERALQTGITLWLREMAWYADIEDDRTRAQHVRALKRDLSDG